MSDFYFATERQRLLENLNFLKSLEVEEYTFYRKWDALRYLRKQSGPSPEWVREAQSRIWLQPRAPKWPADFGTDESQGIHAIIKMKPTIVFIGNPKTDADNFRRWKAYGRYLTSADSHTVPARHIKMLIIDAHRKGRNVLGYAAIGSDMGSLGCRDRFIGWTREQRGTGGMLRHTAIGASIVPTQPFGFNFFGGKLIAALLTTKVVRDEWQLRYGDVLVGMTTTSLFGSPCMYDSLPWWKKLGKTRGTILIEPDKEIYHKWRNWVRAEYPQEFAEASARGCGMRGPDTSEKNRVLGLILQAAGISPADYQHGYPRGVFWSSFYENTNQFLCGQISPRSLRLKYRFECDLGAIMDWWQDRAIEHFQSLVEKGKVKHSGHFYDDLGALDYPTAKAKYFAEVGR